MAGSGSAGQAMLCPGMAGWGLVGFGVPLARSGRVSNGAVRSAPACNGEVCWAKARRGEVRQGKQGGAMESETESALDGREILVKVGPDHGDDRAKDLQRLIAKAWAEEEAKHYPQG